MHRLLKTALALLVLGAPAPSLALTKYVCLRPGNTTWKVPADWSNPSQIDAVTAGGGAAAIRVSGGPWGAPGGGGLHEVIVNPPGLTPGATVTAIVGMGGAPGVYTSPGTGAGGRGGDTYLCSDTSCTTWKTSISPTALVGGQGGDGGYIGGIGGGLGASCSSSTTLPVGNAGYCAGGGQGRVFYSLTGEGGGGGAGGFKYSGGPGGSNYVYNGGSGGAGPAQHTSGSYGGGGGGSAGAGGNSGWGGYGADAVGSVGGTGGTALVAGNGGSGGNGGTSGGTSYGQAGKKGTAWDALIAKCPSPGGGGGAPSADNNRSDPNSATGNSDGGDSGGGAGSPNYMGQGPGTGGGGIIFIQYSGTASGAHSQGLVF